MTKRIRSEYSAKKRFIGRQCQPADNLCQVRASGLSLERQSEWYKARPSWRFSRSDSVCWNIWADLQSFAADVLDKLREFERKTWNDILVAERRHNHWISTEKLNPCAQKRLAELRLDADIDEVLSLRLAGQHRIYGYWRDSCALEILWYDKSHGDNDFCVCRARKKHT